MKTIKDKPYYIRKVVFEARYDYGYEFLDRCGALINSILKENDEWVPNQQITPAGSQFHNLQDKTQMGFSVHRMWFSLSKALQEEPLKPESERMAKLIEHIKKVSPIIISELNLDLKNFKRVGTRVFYYVPFETEEEASDWVIESKIIGISKEDLLDGKLSNPSCRFQWRGPITNYQVNIDIFERNAQLDFGEDILGVRVSQLASRQKETILEQKKVQHRLLVDPEYFVNIDFDFFIEQKGISEELFYGLTEKCIKESESALQKLFS